jgi:hypothetical protein
MSPADLIEFYGSQKAAAKALGVSFKTVSMWRRRGFIPNGRQYQVQLVTLGRLVADPKPRKIQVRSPRAVGGSPESATG